MDATAPPLAPGADRARAGRHGGAPGDGPAPPGGGGTEHRVHPWLRLGVLAAVVLVVWAVVIEPRTLDVRHHDVALPALPAEWAGRRVAVLADIQTGMWLGNDGTARRAVDRLTTTDPALVLVAGDLVRGGSPADEEIAAAVDILAPLPREGIATVAVLGNHDHDSAATERLRRRLEDAGIIVLRNQSVALQPDGRRGGRLHVVGIGARMADRDRPDRALADVPTGAARIAVMHHPATFADLPPGAAPLAVAGHTHGGQVRVPWLAEGSLLDLRSDLPVAGWADGPGGNRLYVNRGIGMSRLPIRFAAPPELTVFTLEPA